MSIVEWPYSDWCWNNFSSGHNEELKKSIERKRSWEAFIESICDMLNPPIRMIVIHRKPRVVRFIPRWSALRWKAKT